MSSSEVLLEPPVKTVDKRGMPQNDFLFDRLSEQNLLVLKSYADRSLSLKTSNHEHDGWVERLETIDTADPDQLTQIHGDLIAMGVLKFEISNRHTGLRYRISERGNAALENTAAEHRTESVGLANDPAEFESSAGHPLSDAV